MTEEHEHEHEHSREGFNWEISFGNILTIVAMSGVAFVGWGTMSARSDVTKASLETLQAANLSLEQRIRTLETSQVRNDEKLNSILDAVRRIEKTMEITKRL